MPAFSMDLCGFMQINGGIFEDWDIAIEAKNSNHISINEVNINNCDKGIRFVNCWNSQVTRLNIDNGTHIGINGYRLNYLSILVKKMM